MSVRKSVTAFLLATAMALAAGTILQGCGAKDNQPSEREQAKKRWAAARANVLVTLAKDQFSSGQIDKARQTTDEALRLAPENAQARLISAKLYIEKGSLEAAQRELDSARAATPNDGEIYYLGGVVLQRWQKYEAAYQQYKLAAEKSPAELAYLLAEAESLVTLDKADEALTLLKARCDYFEHSGTIRDAIGQIEMQKGKFADAARSFRQASILSEDEPSIKERLAVALYKSKQYREAADLLAKLLQSEAFAKRSDLYTILGECQLAAGQPKEARFSFETATQISPAMSQAWLGLGQSAMQAGDARRAELALSKAISLDGTQPQAHLLLGYALTRQNKWEPAKTAFKAAATLDPTDATALCMVGYVLEKQAQPNEAVKYYNKALAVRPGDELARRLLSGLNLDD